VHDLPRRKRGEFRLDTGQPDPLVLFFAEAVAPVAVAAFAAIDTTSITLELLAPALQCLKPYAQHQRQLTGAGTSCDVLMIDQ
jgi:hypothetical protein